MNMQAHMSGQNTGQIPSQTGSQLSAQSQQHVGSIPSQMQNLVNSSSMDKDFLVARQVMRARITQYIQRHQLRAEWLPRLPDIVKRVEEWLLRNASSKEEYMNLETLERRLQNIIKSLLSQNKPLAHSITYSVPMSTMIPTPGMPHGGNMNSGITCSVDSSLTTVSGSGSVTPSSVGVGNIMPTASGAAVTGQSGLFNAADGSVSQGYQQHTANISAMPGINNMMSSVGLPRNQSQMIPTPGLNNAQSVSMRTGGSNIGVYSGVESTMVSQQPKPKQFSGNQNSRILQSLGGQLGANLRSNMQHKYGFSNGVINGGLAATSVPMMDGTAALEGYSNTSAYGNASNAMQQILDQQLQLPPSSLSQQVMPVTGDGYGMTDFSGSSNMYSSATSSGSMVNSQNTSSMSSQAILKPNSALQMHQANFQSIQQTSFKPSIPDSSPKMDFQSSHSAQDQRLQSQQQIHKIQQLQQFQQQTSRPYSQFVQPQYLQKKPNEQHQQVSLKPDTFRQPLMATSLSGQLVNELRMASNDKTLTSQAPDQFHMPELHGQYQQNAVDDGYSKDAKLMGAFTSSQDCQPLLSQVSQKSHQLYHPNQHSNEIQNDLNTISTGSQPEALLQGHWHPQPFQSHVLDQSLSEQHIQNDFQQRIIGHDAAQQPHFSIEESVTAQAIRNCNGVVMPQSEIMSTCGIQNQLREQQYHNQRRWLLFLQHARRCSAPKGKCQEVNCITVQQLVMHMRSCGGGECGYPRCRKSKGLIEHYCNCRAADCPVCVPVREYIASKQKSIIQPSDAGSVYSMNGSWKNVNAMDADRPGSKTSSSSVELSEDLQSNFKKMKVEHSLLHNSKPGVSVSPITQSHASVEALIQGHQQIDTYGSSKLEAVNVKMESSLSCEMESSSNLMRNNIDDFDNGLVKFDAEQAASVSLDCVAKQESMKIDKHFDQTKIELKQELNTLVDSVSATKSGKPKIKGVSLTELFTPEQIREHIIGLRQWVGQSKAKAEKNQAMEHSMSENSCQLCAVEKLTFEPPPIYCTPCGARIKRNAMYYTAGNSETRHYFCIPCYNEVRGDSIEVEGSSILKARLEKKRNDEETEEWWVQCDKCEAWQHQICALFNGRRNDGGQAEYTCPNCCVQEIERGERTPLPQSAVLGAKDLPRTLLSDHLEQRLFKRLKQERQERARHQGKGFDEVAGAEALVVRVVSSVDKKLEVKQRFLEIFQEDNYPTEFPYKSKVILLFQKIEGVEVCLFGMYVQEFGSECEFPNQRRVYLSYLDSVKYFRPEIKTVTGEALRTFVYHEILIGYLEYCKKRGFTSCYIWACPPLKGEDYILYCHPEIQKTPKSDKLREWYLSMLRKASKENIVVDLTNLYDHFFVKIGECKAKVTASRLPYFDGDYWPGAAEDMINQLQQEEDGRKQHKKGKTKKTITKRALKAAGHTDLSGNASKDAMLMQKLGETIAPMKEDFIMVHLQHACTHCCILMASGIRWVCNQCKNFQLCEKCYSEEQKLEERERHPINSRDKHILNPVEIKDVPTDTKDNDEILESEFFDTRQAFLSLCQGNHYQYDTLRRAKHSSMMVLYHLHNPTAPAFVTTCNVCHHDIETGQGWRCEVCPDFDVCNNCYQKDGGVDHPHKLTNHPSMADAQNTEARQKRVLQLRKMLDLLVHASQCRSPQCQYPNCRKVKGLFRHGIMCKIRASGGCLLCKKMWYLLQLHARACKESECHVPRCRDLKEHLRRLQQQSDSRRRAAVMEMMRQRAAEVAGNSG